MKYSLLKLIAFLLLIIKIICEDALTDHENINYVDDDIDNDETVKQDQTRPLSASFSHKIDQIIEIDELNPIENSCRSKKIKTWLKTTQL